MKIKSIKYRIVIILLLCILVLSACHNDSSYKVPTLGNVQIANITDSTVFVRSFIVDRGTTAVRQRGFVWSSTNSYPNTSNSEVFVVEEEINDFSSIISSLSSTTHYYLRSFARNDIGTGYGATINFWTLGAPKVVTLGITDITGGNATLAGKFYNDGGLPIEELGLCFGTDSFPTIDDTFFKLEMSADSTFSVVVSNLSPLTTYFVRAYAKNEKGSAYANPMAFNTIGAVVEDIEGNKYETIIIGEQMWMTSNLRVTHFNDNTPIANVSDAEQWSSSNTASYCYYDNNPLNVIPYGVLYNWYVAKSDNICPIGWRVATDEDWKQLDSFLGIDAAFHLKSFNKDYWINVAGNDNSTNFSAVGNGSRDADGKYIGLKRDAMWWCSVQDNESRAWIWETSATSSGIARTSYYKQRGAAIRCVQDTIE